MKSPKPKKLPKIGNLKKRAWKAFSEFIRKRGADESGFNSCITCGRRDFWKNLQASHFIPGRTNSILFLEDNCFPGCYGCNIGRHGAIEDYYPIMLKKVGQERIDEIKRLKKQVFKPTREWFEQIIEKYK
jgi:NinG protein